jgi:hypothetical protein
MSSEERYGAMRVIELRNEVSCGARSLSAWAQHFFESCVIEE